MNVHNYPLSMDARVAPAADPQLRSRLGYGTSTLMGRLSARDSMRALETAFEHGITHFDTARMYGYGEAEAVLGRFIRNKRDRVTITTKAGIVPPKRSPVLSMLRSAARGAVAVAPGLRRTLRRQAEKTVRSGCFDAATIRASLETSLRELATEQIDFFLLHECEAAHLSADLLDVLQAAVVAGKIGRFGIATTPVASRAIVAASPEFAAVIQLPNSLAFPAEPCGQPAGTTVITHSIFRGDAERVGSLLTHRTDLLGKGLLMPAIVRRAMLEYALRAEPRGVTLFSSANPHHIEENARAARDPLFADDELAALSAALRPSAGAA